MADTPKTDFSHLTEIGATGLNISGGYILEEWLPALWRTRWRQIVKEMRDNDAIVGAVLRAIELLTRGVEWRVEPGSEDNDGRMKAEFLEQCLRDMSETWQDTQSEILSMLPWGFAVQELVYKQRLGLEPPTYKDALGQERPAQPSKYKDSLIGWAKWAPRAQETIETWTVDDTGEVREVKQWPPPTYTERIIPENKFLLFRPTSRKLNPEGVSILRTGWLSWHYKVELQRCEAIGIERELAGLPEFRVPLEYMDPNASADKKAAFENFKKMVRNVRNNEHAGLVTPSDRDPETKELLFEFKLVTTGGQRAIDVDKAITRHNMMIAASMLADFILLGHEKVGSFALSSSKTDLFAVAIGAYLDAIAEVINRTAIPRLWKLNGWPLENLPELKHGDIESVDLNELGEFISKLSGAGYTLQLDDEVQRAVLSAAKLPVPMDAVDNAEQVHTE